MYHYIRDLFVHVLGHDRDHIIVDSSQSESSNAPDLVIRANTGVFERPKTPKSRESEIKHDWAVVEVKDELDAFDEHADREKIFNEKSKYIRLGTEYFVMIDPRRIVVRPVAMRSQLKFDPSHDIEASWEGMTRKKFCDTFERLHCRHAKELSALRNFRAGDESQIAVVKVDLPAAEKAKLTAAEKKRLQIARDDFLEAIRQSTGILQSACVRALDKLDGEITKMANEFHEFDERWKGHTLSFDPVKIKGTNVQGMDEHVKHGRQSSRLASVIRRRPSIAKLVDRALPAYVARTGNVEDLAPFACESANLILARILLMRFFEDHNFFGEKKYVCNGGVAELQQFIEHRERGYAIVLQTAYYEGAKIYADAFDYTDMDWVLDSENREVSRAIELAMFYFSRFDFSTVSGDILTGIYDRFLDRQQRKKMGEFYTPPSVARHIVKRLDAKAGDKIFDPACGSGTFLLEAFARMTGGDIRNGLGNWAQAKKALSCIGGNDLNPFSAVIARIQMLWHLLPLKEELKKYLIKQQGWFSEIQIADSFNALIPLGLSRQGSPYEFFDDSISDIVVGNPPYVRPERATDFADAETTAFFKSIGGAGKNLYDLFVYKALAHWCKKGKDGQKPGRVGFIIPLSFCDSDNSAPLRKMFALGGQFRVMEIVDMESIAPHVFDASVNPIILFAENRPAKKSDKIIIRVAGESCIVSSEKRDFDFSKAPTASFRYDEIWTEDGRILTRTNSKRRCLALKMAACGQTLSDIARPYWVGRNGGNKISRWRGTPPEEHFGNDDNGPVWEERIMLALGASFRNKWKAGAGGMDFYKGENIRACRVEGAPVKENILPESVSSPSLWKYRDILPPVGYAFLAISLGITAARFKPRERVFMDTSVLLFPNAKWEKFPIDIALMSRVFQFYCASHLRMGVVTQLWSHLYPRNLRMIPWPAALKKGAAKLEKMRARFLKLCESISSRPAALHRAMQAAGALTLQDECRARGASLDWSDSIKKSALKDFQAPKTDSILPSHANGIWKLSLDGKLAFRDAAWFGVDKADIAARAAAALTVFNGESVDKEKLLTMQIPKDDKALKKFVRAVADYDKGGDSEKFNHLLDDIDAIVGGAFGLSASDIRYIQKEMREDEFLRHIRPNLPYTGKQQRGSAESLQSPSRYRNGNSVEAAEE